MAPDHDFARAAPIVALNDVTAPGVALTAAANDSGARARIFPAGRPIMSTAAQTPTGSGKQAAAPSNVNVVVQYKLASAIAPGTGVAPSASSSAKVLTPRS